MSEESKSSVESENPRERLPSIHPSQLSECAFVQEEIDQWHEQVSRYLARARQYNLNADLKALRIKSYLKILISIVIGGNLRGLQSFLPTVGVSDAEEAVQLYSALLKQAVELRVTMVQFLSQWYVQQVLVPVMVLGGDPNGLQSLMASQKIGRKSPYLFGALLAALTQRDPNPPIKIKMLNVLFIEAAKYDQVPMLQFLLQCGVSADTKYSEGYTALMRAVEFGCVNAVAFLLAQPNTAVNARYKNTRGNGSTALHFAAQHGDERIVELLLQGKAELNTKDNNDCTAFMYAVSALHDDAASALAEQGAAFPQKNPWAPDFSDAAPWLNQDGRCEQQRGIFFKAAFDRFFKKYQAEFGAPAVSIPHFPVDKNKGLLALLRQFDLPEEEVSAISALAYCAAIDAFKLVYGGGARGQLVNELVNLKAEILAPLRPALPLSPENIHHCSSAFFGRSSLAKPDSAQRETTSHALHVVPIGMASEA